MKQFIGKNIQFKEAITEIDAYPEPGMRARIVSIEPVEVKNDPAYDVYKIIFDYSEFDDFNTNFESSNYYDKRGQACLTARQAGFYNQVDTVYFGSPEFKAYEEFFTLLDEKKESLQARFRESGFKNYVEWLEEQVS